MTMVNQPLHPKEPRERAGRLGNWKTFPSRIKRNPLVAGLVLLCTAVIALYTFSDAARGLFGLAREATATSIGGAWITPTLTNPYDSRVHYHLIFTFQVHDQKKVSGLLIYTDEANPRAADTQPVLDGHTENEFISFRTEFTNGLDSKIYSTFYEGKAVSNEIQFRTWTNLPAGGDVQTFLATRQPNSR
jgi:hypothetical protein